jgi:hypothetical protein
MDLEEVTGKERGKTVGQRHTGPSFGVQPGPVLPGRSHEGPADSLRSGAPLLSLHCTLVLLEAQTGLVIYPRSPSEPL